MFRITPLDSVVELYRLVFKLQVNQN